jgi:hypothetical protein
VALFEELFDRLVAMGFAGQITVNVHTGNFCMVTNGTDGYELAAGSSGADQCDRIWYDPAESLGRGLRQSVAFANFVDTAEEETGGAIRFNIVARGPMESPGVYPVSAAGLTAAEWNAIAAQNNRVEVELQSDNN